MDIVLRNGLMNSAWRILGAAAFGRSLELTVANRTLVEATPARRHRN
jgi:hypothetical protein